MGPTDTLISCQDGRIFFTLFGTSDLLILPSKLRMISAKPNKPMLNGTKSMPSCSSSIPKVKRKAPELTSVPINPKSKPSNTMQMALSSEPVASTVALTRPRTIKLKYSAGPN